VIVLTPPERDLGPPEVPRVPPTQRAAEHPTRTSPVDDLSNVPSPLYYAQHLGWSVFPCHWIERAMCSCPKRADCSASGKHPLTRNGSKDATTDPDIIRAWMSRWPKANWAVNTGMSGLLVVDVDRRNGGFDSLRKWQEENGELPPTLMSLTGGAGRHYFYAGVGVPSRKWRPGIEIKATGNQHVILPPSRHISGGSYSWMNSLEMALPPTDLVESIRQSSAGSSTGGGDLDLVEVLNGVAEGKRDETLFRAACAYRNQLGDNRGAVEILIKYAAANCSPPFPEIDALRKVEQAFLQDRYEVADWMVAMARGWGEQASRGLLNLRQASEIMRMERPEMLIEDVLPPGGLFQIFGQTGEYKSFIAVAMLGAVANGGDWLGKKVTESGDVALVLGEGGFDAGDRLKAWLHGNPGCTADRMLYSVEEGLDLMDGEQVDQIIEELTSDPTKEWKLIIFDTQADHMPSGDEDKSKDFTVIKKAVQRIAQATGAAVGLIHHTGWDDSRERGSSRQRQALDVVMQIKDQRITNIKQKYGPKFEPIMFTVEEAPGTGSIFVRSSTEAEQLRLAFDSVNKVSSEANAVKALAIMLGDPGISGNEIVKQLHIQKSSWSPLRGFLEMRHYIECDRDDDGKVVGMSVTEHGADWLAAKQSEAS
jgi:Bifunctional DNA primase/polymerase, N-terminal/AAA domain